MSKKLVAFFSASGVTAKVAKKLADVTGADLYEIKPEEPYTKADLNWQDKSSRSSVEMDDKACRPPLSDTDAGVAGASLIFIGFPVWWYREPSVIDTFLEAYDFSGKTIVPFCTSGSSGIGQTAERMQEIVGNGAKVLSGRRFAAGVTENELKRWSEEIDS